MRETIVQFEQIQSSNQSLDFEDNYRPEFSNF